MQLGILALAVRQPLLDMGYISESLVSTEGCMYLCNTALGSRPSIETAKDMAWWVTS